MYSLGLRVRACTHGVHFGWRNIYDLASLANIYFVTNDTKYSDISLRAAKYYEGVTNTLLWKQSIPSWWTLSRQHEQGSFKLLLLLLLPLLLTIHYIFMAFIATCRISSELIPLHMSMHWQSVSVFKENYKRKSLTLCARATGRLLMMMSLRDFQRLPGGGDGGVGVRVWMCVPNDFT